MSALPTPLVDALPERLWFYGNLYRVFGRDVHCCVGDEGHRTIEVDGVEVGRGRPIGDVPPAPADPRVGEWLYLVDIGWVTTAALIALASTAILGRRTNRDHGRRRVSADDARVPVR
jgi:hypothetical protein